MSTAELRTESASPALQLETAWERFTSAYECPVLICPEEVGGFSVHALTLPGAVSQGESEGEAMVNIAEAIALLLEEYTENGVAIPWQTVVVDDIPKNARTRWILVNA